MHWQRLAYTVELVRPLHQHAGIKGWPSVALPTSATAQLAIATSQDQGHNPQVLSILYDVPRWPHSREPHEAPTYHIAWAHVVKSMAEQAPMRPCWLAGWLVGRRMQRLLAHLTPFIDSRQGHEELLELFLGTLRALCRNHVSCARALLFLL